jgi:hypothetical protein
MKLSMMKNRNKTGNGHLLDSKILIALADNNKVETA